nr:MAG TPA: hypothetical protein [Caudoviricetes sp.]DAS84342.1 MAG TPA: hypothetical protein [Caudoviricetes sp.]
MYLNPFGDKRGELRSHPLNSPLLFNDATVVNIKIKLVYILLS